MTAERLRQYKSIKAEIEELAEQIQMLESSDIVQGSDREFPYIKHNMKVEMNLLTTLLTAKQGEFSDTDILRGGHSKRLLLK